MHDEGSWWVSGAIERMSGTYPKAALAGLLDGARALYREGALHITPTSMTAENDRVAVEATSFATMQDGRIYANSRPEGRCVGKEWVSRCSSWWSPSH